MATTSQTYPSNSLISTSASASTSSSTPTNDPIGTGDSIAELLSSSGSTPLIVAFLAIGLFVVAITGVFGWRRLSRSQEPNHWPIVAPHRRRKLSISLGKRPVLWDLWADLNVPETSPAGATRWENTTPMTAVLTFLIPHVRPVEPSQPIKSVDPASHVLFRTWRRLVSAVKRSYLPDPPSPPPPPPLSPPIERDGKEVVRPGSHTSDEIEWGDASSLQVSVIVAMPSQRRCGSGTSGKDADQEGMVLGEFCIGTMDVPWSEGG